MTWLNYIDFIAVLIEALKEQQNQTQQLFEQVKN
jgi:flagellar biosynthesis chaperone FliJ